MDYNVYGRRIKMIYSYFSVFEAAHKGGKRGPLDVPDVMDH